MTPLANNSFNQQTETTLTTTMTQQQQPQQPQPSQYSYKPGSIRSIKLINFMCHQSFELPFGPRVNFVIGPNGSGKSALLTALVVALGGRATVTSRAKRADEFVMYGKSQAKIVIVLHNYEKASDKYQGFKPDDYGKTITIEKTLLKDGQHKLVLKNDRDKKVSERKAELDEMLDHFQILINNPVCILNQEVSKSFLHSKKSEDKFDLFMKATNLEQIEEDYSSARKSHQDWDESNAQKAVVFKMLDKEYAACSEKIGFLLNRGKMLSNLEKLKDEILWAIVRDNELSSNKLQEIVSKLDETINNAQEEIDKRTEKIKTTEEDLQIMKDKATSMSLMVDEARKKVFDTRMRETDVKKNRVEVKTKVEQSEKRIARLKQDHSNLESSIDELKKKFRDQNALDQDSEQRKLRIECLNREIPAEQARENTIKQHTEQLNCSMTSTRSELQAANLRNNEIKTKLAQKHAILRRLKNGQDNALRKFGDSAVRINEEIEKAYSQNKFKVKPLGPLGYYIKLKSSDIAKPLECLLGRNAMAYVCDNHQDMTTLNSIFKRCSINSNNFRVPTILTRRFGPRHDVSRYKAEHDVYRTFLDYIDVDNDVVYNALADRCNLESILFIPDYNEAEHIMINPQLVPRNTRCAYTRECSVMYPKTNHGCYKSLANPPDRFVLFIQNNSDQIKETEREIELINADLRDSESICKRIQESLSAQRGEYEENQTEIRKVLAVIRKMEEELLQLKTTVYRQPEELSVYENDLTEIGENIVKEKGILEKNKAILETFNKDLELVKRDIEECQHRQKQCEEKKTAVDKIIEATTNTINDHKFHIRSNKSVVDNRSKDKVEESKKLDAALVILDKSKQAIQQHNKRPLNIGLTETIKKEIVNIERQLNADLEDMRDPEEMKQSIENRMKEIEDLNGLKKKNEANFELSHRTLKQREDGLMSLKVHTVSHISSTFSVVMRNMNMNGKLSIHLTDELHQGHVVKKARTLEMNIDTHYTPSQRVPLNDPEYEALSGSPVNRRISRSQPGSVAAPRAKRARTNASTDEKENRTKMTDSRSLSGGERSFSTVAFVLSLWHHCSSPFKLMDEIDVFMDMVTRRVSYNALIRFAQVAEDPGQFVFFSPLELPKVDDSGEFVRVFEMPSIIRKKNPASQEDLVLDN